MMTENRAPNGKLGVIIGALIAVGLAVFLLTGGEHVGQKDGQQRRRSSTGRNGAVALTASSSIDVGYLEGSVSCTPAISGNAVPRGIGNSGFTATKISKQRHKDF